MAYLDDLKAKAKQLYLTLDDKGEQVYKNLDIAKEIDKIKKKSTKGKTSHTTIAKWRDEGNWQPDLVEQQAKLKQKIADAEKKRKAKMKADQKASLGKAHSTYEDGYDANEQIYGKAHAIIMKQLEATEKLVDGDVNQIKNALPPQQLIALFKTASEKKTKHEEILAEASSVRDNKLEVTIHVERTK